MNNVPDGFVLMPVEPTDEIIDSMSEGFTDIFGIDMQQSEFKRIYKKIIKSGQQP